jgi:hypothetical protein
MMNTSNTYRHGISRSLANQEELLAKNIVNDDD